MYEHQQCLNFSIRFNAYWNLMYFDFFSLFLKFCCLMRDMSWHGIRIFFFSYIKHQSCYFFLPMRRKIYIGRLKNRQKPIYICESIWKKNGNNLKISLPYNGLYFYFKSKKKEKKTTTDNKKKILLSLSGKLEHRSRIYNRRSHILWNVAIAFESQFFFLCLLFKCNETYLCDMYLKENTLWIIK